MSNDSVPRNEEAPQDEPQTNYQFTQADYEAMAEAIDFYLMPTTVRICRPPDVDSSISWQVYSKGQLSASSDNLLDALIGALALAGDERAKRYAEVKAIIAAQRTGPGEAE